MVQSIVALVLILALIVGFTYVVRRVGTTLGGVIGTKIGKVIADTEEAVATARSTRKFPSPDRAFEAQLLPHEVQPEHWVETPSLQNLKSKAILFNLSPLWHADDLSWSPDGQVLHIVLRLYPGQVTDLGLEVRVREQVAQVSYQGEVSTVSLAVLGEWLDRKMGRV